MRRTIAPLLWAPLLLMACPDDGSPQDTVEVDTSAAPDTNDTNDTGEDVPDDTGTLEDVPDDTGPLEDVTDTALDTNAPDTAPDDTTPDEDVADTDPADTTVALTPLPINVPAGFEVHTAGRGVTVYRKDYSPGQPDWVTVVDLRVARIRNIFGAHRGAPMGSIERRAPSRHWDDARNRTVAGAGRPRVMLSGTYFGGGDLAGIAFGLKADGDVISYGYGASEYPSQTKTLGWSDSHAEIAPYDMQTPDFRMFEDFPNVAGGLAVGAHPAAALYRAKVSVATRDFDGDGAAEAVFFMSSLYTREQDMQDLLTEFGATDVIVWTGNTTAFMLVDGREVVAAENPVPHSVAIFDGPPDHACPCDADRCDNDCACRPGYGGDDCDDCIDCDPTEVIVDDTDPGFHTFGRTYWWTRADPSAWGGSFHYTGGDASQTEVWNGAWETPTPLRGTYDVDVFVVAPADFDPSYPGSNWTPCTTVRYRVLHDAAPAGQVIVKGHLTPGWMKLGTFTYSERRGIVRLRDGAEPQWCGVQLDAVRFTRVSD